MKIGKTTMVLAISIAMLTVMAGTAMANPEQIAILPDGSIVHPIGLTPLPSPLLIQNDGTTPYNLDVGLWDYMPVSPAWTSHTMVLSMSVVSGAGASPSDITITATERSGGTTVSGAGTVTLTWTQDAAGGPTAFDYIDVDLVSTGPYGAQYQLTITDTGYQSSGGAVDTITENITTTNIPEFATIALPLAATIGLFMFFDHRRKQEEE